MALNLIPEVADVDAGAVAAQLAEAQQKLHAALMAGAPTKDVHAEIAALKAAAARITAEAAAARAEADAQAARAHEARVTQTAAGYVTDITRRLESRLASLVPSPFSTPTPTRIPSR